MCNSKYKAELLAEVLNQRVVGIVSASKDGKECDLFDEVVRGVSEIPLSLTNSNKLQADTTIESESIIVTWKVE